MSSNKKERKLRPMSRITAQEPSEMDSVAYEKSLGGRRAFDILMEAQKHWNNMAQYRKDRARNKRYTYGDQWKDEIEVDGKMMTEEDYIKSQGNVPLKNNLIRRFIRNVLGAFRGQSKEPVCVARDRDEQKLGQTMSMMLQYNMQLNQMSEVYARSMEEFLIGGLVVHKKWYGHRIGKKDCWTDYVCPSRFFIDSNAKDFRGWDVSFIGEVHDLSFLELCSQFAESPKDFERLKEIYKYAHKKNYLMEWCERFGYSDERNLDFLHVSNQGMCRVVEVWRKEYKPRCLCHDPHEGRVYKIELEDYDNLVLAENARREEKCLAAGMSREEIPFIKATWYMDDYWYYYYLSPFGDILKEGETPYDHEGHPYVFKAYPFIDGEIHSFVNDVIDQQRYTNRLITLYDWIMRSSAKGVLLVPDDCISDEMSLSEIADSWSRFNGVIAIKVKQGVPMPQQIASNATNIGITELLNIQLKLFEDISGVHGALQGKPGNSGMSASLYAQQAQNASSSLVDLLDSFSSFVRDGAIKDVKNIQQFYDDKRVYNIAGRAGSAFEYDPAKIRDVEFDLSITESTSTPVYRQIANDFLMQIWQSGQITLTQLLEHGDFPFADELLQSIKSAGEQMQQGEQAGGAIPEGVMSQAQAQADPQSLAMAQQYIGMSA